MRKNLKPAIFMHIQKTAGTTIVDLARSTYGNQNIISHGDYLNGIKHFPLVDELEIDELEINEQVLQDFHKIPFLSGHFGYGFAKQYLPYRYSFTFLRDPVERVLSFYYFCKKRDPKQYKIYKLCQQSTLDEFLKMGLVNPEVKYFIWNNQVWQLACGFGNLENKLLSSFEEAELLDLAINHLHVFSYVGFAETFEDDRNTIFKDLGVVPPEEKIISNANPDRPAFIDLPQSTKHLLLELTELDRGLYEKAWARKTARFKGVVNRWLGGGMNSMSETLPDTVQCVRNDYLELMQACLTGSVYRDPAEAPFGPNTFDSHHREHGLDWPSHAETMIGDKRLANVRTLTEAVIADNVPGDLIETGVWRGGACIMMRAVLYAYNVGDRYVWVADSFEGLPRANEPQYPEDAGSDFHTYEQLAVSLDEVRENFRAYGLLDEQVKFLKGWFKDTLPTATIGRLALLRLDGDMYESTMDALTNLYPKLSNHGYVIIDDYHVVPACKAAVTDYCDKHGIKPEIIEIDGVGVYWRKSDGVERERTFIRTNQAAASQDSQITQLSEDIARLYRTVMTRLNQSLVERDAQIARLQRALADRDAELAALYLSYSWKVVKRIRAIAKSVRAILGR
jgi:O-methyltransferase